MNTSDIKDIEKVLEYIGEIEVQKVEVVSGGLVATVKQINSNDYGTAGEVKVYRITGDYYRHPENAEIERLG